ncbi:hypothetical protein IMG5_087580, partial [Ichthyophthirius multifiliis]
NINYFIEKKIYINSRMSKIHIYLLILIIFTQIYQAQRKCVKIHQIQFCIFHLFKDCVIQQIKYFYFHLNYKQFLFYT